MRHLIAPSSMPEAKPTSIQSSSQKGMRAHHPNLSRSRRDTPSYGALETSAVPPAKVRSLRRNQPLDRGSRGSALAPKRPFVGTGGTVISGAPNQSDWQRSTFPNSAPDNLQNDRHAARRLSTNV
jgi:hypothetical protein